jgi:hypothetical protein
VALGRMVLQMIETDEDEDGMIECPSCHYKWPDTSSNVQCIGVYGKCS